MYGFFVFLQLEGYFVPPITTNYTFYIASDDYSDLFMSPNESESSIALLSFSAGWSGHYWTRSGQISTPRWLVAGKRYFMRARQQENGGGDHLFVAMRIHNTSSLKTDEENRYLSLRERQIVRISTVVVREVQTITITGVTSGTFKVICAKGTTSLIDIGSSNLGSMASDLSSLSVCNDVRVSRSAVNTTFTYNVTFNCPSNRSSIPLRIFNFNLQPASGQAYSGSVVTAVPPSLPLAGYYKLRFLNSTTAPILNIWDPSSELRKLPGIGEIRTEWSGNAYESFTIFVEFITYMVCSDDLAVLTLLTSIF